jgi:hypothetical protein
MDQAAGALRGISQINGATVGHIDSQELAWGMGHEAISIRPSTITLTPTANRDVIPVNLIAEPCHLRFRDFQVIAESVSMIVSESGKSGVSVGLYIDSRASKHKAMDEARDGFKRGEGFDGRNRHQIREAKSGREFP